MGGWYERQEPDVVSLVGEIDLSNVGDLPEELERTARAYGRVVVDLTEATYIDSTGLAAILLTAGRGYHVIVRKPNGTVRRLMDICGALDVVDVEE